MRAADKPDLGADGPAALARRTRDATFRGNVVARTVASEHLETLHGLEFLDDEQYAAGVRLRRAYASSWQSPRWAGMQNCASDPSPLDELAETMDPEQFQRHCFRLWTEARKILRHRWDATIMICGGTGRPDLKYAQEGLAILAKLWSAEKRLDASPN